MLRDHGQPDLQFGARLRAAHGRRRDHTALRQLRCYRQLLLPKYKHLQSGDWHASHRILRAAGWYRDAGALHDLWWIG